MLKVMIVDDELNILAELRQILSASSGYEVCEEYTDAFSAMEALCFRTMEIQGFFVPQDSASIFPSNPSLAEMARI